MCKKLSSVFDVSKSNMTFQIFGCNNYLKWDKLHEFQPSNMATSNRESISGLNFLKTTWSNSTGYAMYIIKHSKMSTSEMNLNNGMPLLSDAGIIQIHEIEWG